MSHGNDLHQGKTGAANLALESGAPIVPVGFYVPDEHARMIEQDRESGDRATRWQFGGRCTVQIGEPWHLDMSLYPEHNHRAMRAITEEMMTRIQELVGLAKKSMEK